MRKHAQELHARSDELKPRLLPVRWIHDLKQRSRSYQIARRASGDAAPEFRKLRERLHFAVDCAIIRIAASIS
jgi:hypothetical protein